MTTPVSARIIDSVVTALEGITVANGYWKDVERVQPADHFVPDWSGIALPAMLVGAVEADMVGDDTGAGTEGLLDWRMSFAVLAASGPRENSDGWAQGEMHELQGAIVRAVMTDPGRNGLAVVTLPKKVLFQPENLPQFDAAVAVVFETYYRTLYSDLTQGA